MAGDRGNARIVHNSVVGTPIFLLKLCSRYSFMTELCRNAVFAPTFAVFGVEKVLKRGFSHSEATLDEYFVSVMHSR